MTFNVPSNPKQFYEVLNTGGSTLGRGVMTSRATWRFGFCPRLAGHQQMQPRGINPWQIGLPVLWLMV